jgi:hypothetical protein
MDQPSTDDVLGRLLKAALVLLSMVILLASV